MLWQKVCSPKRASSLLMMDLLLHHIFCHSLSLLDIFATSFQDTAHLWVQFYIFSDWGHVYMYIYILYFSHK